MNHNNLVIEAMQLEIAAVDAIRDAGCVHEFVDHRGPVQMEVPIDAAHFDPQSGLIWIELNAERLPRPFTCQSLLDAGLKDAVAKRFGHSVEAMTRGTTLIIVTMVSLDAAVEQQNDQALPLVV